MRVSSVNYSMPLRGTNFAAKTSKNDNKVSMEGVDGEKLIMSGNAQRYFTLEENISNAKIGSKFIIRPVNPRYSDLRVLITPESNISAKDFSISVGKDEKPSFKGTLYGSIREQDGISDKKMEREYARFWLYGMHAAVLDKYSDKQYAPSLKKDYNFFIPSDGDGTRYKDITALQGGVTKPASDIPAAIDGKQMSLIQGVITNFTRTGKLNKGFSLIRVEPAKGSAYAFLEGLRKGQIQTDKPIVFSWGDNFSDINISRLMKDFEDSNSGFSITVLPVDKSRTKALSIVKSSDIESRKIDKFVEKPQDDDFIESCIVPEFGKDKCLSAVGPYIISPEALQWIKDGYTQSPEKFLNPDKGYDFSSMIIAPILDAFNNGEIQDKNGNPLEMKFNIIDKEETWSDLGKQKDLSQAMKDIRNGRYQYLPSEVRTSMKRNIDGNDNITFNDKSNVLLHSYLKSIVASASNVIAYSKV